MIYEYRVYDVAPGRMEDLHNRFRNYTLELYAKHGIKVIAFFTSVIGESSDRLTYILAFDNLDHREKAWASFFADPDWQRVYRESNANGQLVLRFKNRIFKPTDYSPLS